MNKKEFLEATHLIAHNVRMCKDYSVKLPSGFGISYEAWCKDRPARIVLVNRSWPAQEDLNVTLGSQFPVASVLGPDTRLTKQIMDPFFGAAVQVLENTLEVVRPV